MCNRYSLIESPAVLARRFNVDDALFRLLNYGPKYNLAPTEEGISVIQDGDRRVPRRMSFGLIPRWAKDARIASQLLNARSETVTEKPAFRESFRSRRCLVLADGFYEWRKEGKERLPQRVVLKSGEPFAFAGLWDSWLSPHGKEIESFTILTTESNEAIRPLHDRMPVILSRENEPLWLAPYVTEARTLAPLLKPCPPELLRLYPVDTYVNKAGNEGPRCIQPSVQPELF